MLKRTIFLVTLLCIGCGDVAEEKAVQPRTPREKPAGLSTNQIRVVLENRAGDDSSREHIFKIQIKALGQRCDSIDRAIMGAPGEWTISCGPGYEYRLSYDANGKPVRAQRAE